MISVPIGLFLTVWRYTPSHSQLLLVADSARDSNGRGAICFKGVESIQIDTTFFCSEVLHAEYGETDSSYDYFLISGERGFRVRAMYMLLNDNYDYLNDILDPFSELEWEKV